MNFVNFTNIFFLKTKQSGNEKSLMKENFLSVLRLYLFIFWLIILYYSSKIYNNISLRYRGIILIDISYFKLKNSTNPLTIINTYWLLFQFMVFLQAFFLKNCDKRSVQIAQYNALSTHLR